MSTSYKSIAVAGGGQLGIPIVEALAAKGVPVLLLSRHGIDKALPAGVTVAQVDYAGDALAVEAVFREHKVDAVVSTVAIEAIPKQTVLVDAAKAADVKLFVPSEFGRTSEGLVGNPKNEIAEYIKAAGIPYTRIFNGMFTEFIPLLVGLGENGKITIVGKGEAPISYTAIPDIAGFVAHILTSVPPSKIENRILRLQGDRASLRGLGPMFNTTVEYVEKIDGAQAALRTHLMLSSDGGVGSTGWDPVAKAEGEGEKAAGSANALWPEHNWKSIREVHNL